MILIGSKPKQGGSWTLLITFYRAGYGVFMFMGRGEGWVVDFFLKARFFKIVYPYNLSCRNR
jgi:hypothetical protein